MRHFLLTGAVLLLLTASASAQSLAELRSGTVAFYTFAESGEITVTVKLWGGVAQPGLYEVRQGMPLSTLLTLAGGPQAVQDSRTRRTLSIRLFRPTPDGSAPTLFYEVEMEGGIQVLQNEPTLLHGDLVLVEENLRQPFSWRDGLSIVTATASLAAIVIQIARSGG